TEQVLAVVAALRIAAAPFEVAGAVFGERTWVREQKQGAVTG
ncbi:MAG: hypothetical protein QOI98_846, partial [Solirubrobacteraceae bacterium]|nr:hypothetical protein [Solirubrobacteraceae bacterium]